MKFILFCFALTLLTTTTIAQKANDALLLDMYQNQKYKEAADYLKSIYTEPIIDMKVLSRFAYTYQMAGKPVDALAYYQRMYNQDSTNLGVLFNLAGINANRDDNAKAILYYQKIIAIDSLNFNVNKQLGRLYHFKSDTVNTVKYLSKANKINPEEAEVASELSGFYAFQSKFKEADVVLRHALAADTTNIILIRSLMKLNYNMGKFPATIKFCKTLLELGDNSADNYNKMGSSYYALKNYECCIEAFLLLPTIFQTERTYYLTAISFKKLKDYGKCLEYLDLTLKQSISPNTYAYYSEMADTYQTTHKLKAATTNYQKSLFFEEKPMVFYSLASLYDNDLKDKRNAIKYFKKYIDSKPPVKEKDYVEYSQSRIKVLSGK